MAQVYRFTDENGQVRLFAEIAPDPVPAAGSLIPVADATGVTVDTTTYNDTIKGSGKLTTLVFPVEQGALAIALAGDAFPRWLLSSDASDYGLLLGDGTFDLSSAGGFINATAQHGLQVGTGGVAGVGVTVSPGASAANHIPQLQQLSPKYAISSGALPTQQLVSGTGAQLASPGDGRDVETVTPFTGDGTNNACTCVIALSADNVTYSTLNTRSYAAAVNLTGAIDVEIGLRVPAGWYLKLTATHGTLGTTTYY